jgi:hypothetical protein
MKSALVLSVVLSKKNFVFCGGFVVESTAPFHESIARVNPAGTFPLVRDESIKTVSLRRLPSCAEVVPCPARGVWFL